MRSVVEIPFLYRRRSMRSETGDEARFDLWSLSRDVEWRREGGQSFEHRVKYMLVDVTQTLLYMKQDSLPWGRKERQGIGEGKKILKFSVVWI